jgi:hypothetical protein
MTADGAAPAGSERVGRPLSHAAILTTVMALRHLDSRLSPLEARLGLAGNGGSDVDQRHAEALKKQADTRKEIQIDKIEKAVARHEASKMPNDNLEPVEATDDPAEPDDDRAKYGLGRFDPSCGSQAQKTPRHPVGGAMTLVREGQNAKEFFDRERAQKRVIMAQIQEGIAQRWQ